MEFLLFIAACVLVIYFIKRRNKIHFVIHHAPIIDKKVVGYRKRLRIMNHSEAALYFELRKQLPSDYFIFPNMRIADVLDAINGPGFYLRRNKILPRHLDFVICNSSFTPIIAVELNGSSHNTPDRLDKDMEKKEILNDAKLPLEVINVGEDFTQASSRIISSLDTHLPRS